ncbi:MAG TPA: DUF480 domain-containing protein [Solirubrobacteraceae bacterium]|nr:DUF480 domain-containing protein [Solirubrobacteraceae bacterium]
MHFTELTAPEQRVLGCLIEKRWTTPDQYPLSLNALRLACNQSTNRDPVTRYDEDTVYRAAQRLCQYGLARLASGHSSRATKYRHLAEEGLGLGREQLAVLAVLLLRGAQTPGELKARSERMARVQSLAEIERVLAELAERGYARRLDRRPGQKEDRFIQLLGGELGGEDPGAEESAVAGAGARLSPEPSGGSGTWAGSAGSAASRPHPEPGFVSPEPPAVTGPVVDPQLESRIAALEAEVAAIRSQLEELLG